MRMILLTISLIVVAAPSYAAQVGVKNRDHLLMGTLDAAQASEGRGPGCRITRALTP